MASPQAIQGNENPDRPDTSRAETGTRRSLLHFFPAVGFRQIRLEERGRFLLEYIDLLLQERVPDAADGKRLAGHARWVINKLRALGSYYTRGVDGGSRLRSAINSAGSIDALRETIVGFFIAPRASPEPAGQPIGTAALGAS